jgi:N-formylglutamate amidohydrolase
MTSDTNFVIKGKISVKKPRKQTLPLVVSSPHSGRNYPSTFVATSNLTPLRLRSSEDSFVDEVFDFAPKLGASFIKALFPRAFLDVNRQPFELDPSMFSERLPNFVTTQNSRISAGLGTIARVVSNGEQIYTDKLTFSEAEARINDFYWPYHRALKTLIDDTKKEFGYCILLDCHSMPSGQSRPKNSYRSSAGRLGDIVLGDCYGTSCNKELMNSATEILSGYGFSMRRNIPYAGGFITRNYGKPREGVHAIQIELNRALYMDEKRIERLDEIKLLTKSMTDFMNVLGSLLTSNDIAAE